MLHVVLFTRKRMCLWGISKILCSTEVFRTLLIFNEGNILPKLSVGKKQKKENCNQIQKIKINVSVLNLKESMTPWGVRI